jgi:GT2 family glycosyltransferase
MENSITIRIVCATRMPEVEFWGKSALGISLQRLKFDQRIRFSIFYNNSLGLPSIYNQEILSNKEDDYLVFMHDDIWIDDYFLAQRVIDGLNEFDIIGVAGNSSRSEFQPAWMFKDSNLIRDSEHNLSGTVAHGRQAFGFINFYGMTPKEVVLLDGLFLAAKKQSLRVANVYFDEQFLFNFYDLDFCRSATKNGLRIGTWPIALTHQSVGMFGDHSWRDSYQRYLQKWGS